MSAFPIQKERPTKSEPPVLLVDIALHKNYTYNLHEDWHCLSASPRLGITYGIIMWAAARVVSTASSSFKRATPPPKAKVAIFAETAACCCFRACIVIITNCGRLCWRRRHISLWRSLHYVQAWYIHSLPNRGPMSYVLSSNLRHFLCRIWWAKWGLKTFAKDVVSYPKLIWTQAMSKNISKTPFKL